MEYLRRGTPDSQVGSPIQLARFFDSSIMFKERNDFQVEPEHVALVSEVHQLDIMSTRCLRTGELLYALGRQGKSDAHNGSGDQHCSMDGLNRRWEIRAVGP